MSASTPMPSPSPGLFIAGTDTGVGKTMVGCALLRAAQQRGRRLVPFKPAETGIDPEPLDALRLHEAAGAPVPLDRVCVYPLRLPAAPQAAAALEGVTISLERIVQRARELTAAGDGLLVEAAGGLLVPYAPGLTGADLAERLGLPVLLVARSPSSGATAWRSPASCWFKPNRNTSPTKRPMRRSSSSSPASRRWGSCRIWRDQPPPRTPSHRRSFRP
jgi:dethiobiotin synthase